MTVTPTDYAPLLRQTVGDQLTHHLLEAPADQLVLCLDNPQLAENQLLLILRRGDLPTPFLERVAAETRWAKSYLVKSALVIHPHTPKITAASLVKFLFWRDLAKLVANFNLDPVVRRQAEVVLRDRIEEITLGERVTLARLAPRELLKTLRADHNERVIAALLSNPRLTEEDVQWIAASKKTPPNLLTLVARADRWVARYMVRLALVRNPRTPLADALHLLPGVLERDAKGVSELPELASALRAAAKTRLKRQV